MKTKLSKNEIKRFIAEAEEGYGRETEIGGQNFQVDITILEGDVTNHPELVGGTVRVFLNKRQKYIGHRVLPPLDK